MTCDDARERFVDLLHDRLGPEERQALRQHLNECTQCSEELAAVEQIASLIRTRASYHRAPAHLREAILRELRRQSGILGMLRAALTILWTTPAALCATTAMVTLALALPLYHHWVVPKPQMVSQVVNEGARAYLSLLLSYPPQGTSPTDPTQIRQWLLETLGFSPPVSFWGNQDFRLLRGYPTYINDRPAVCLIFKTGDVISTFYIFSGPDMQIPPHNRRQIDTFKPYLTTAYGHRVLLWKQGDLAYLIVSNLDDPKLDQLFLRIRKP